MSHKEIQISFWKGHAVTILQLQLYVSFFYVRYAMFGVSFACNLLNIPAVYPRAVWRGEHTRYYTDLTKQSAIGSTDQHLTLTSSQLGPAVKHKLDHRHTWSEPLCQ